MAPEWTKFEKNHLTVVNSTKILILSVNCDDHKDIADHKKLWDSLPFTYIHQNGETKEFRGDRNIDGFEKFLKQNV